jgi:hypothetical protein
MELNPELLEQLKKHTQAIKQAMPDLTKEKRMEIITKAINDSNDIPSEMKEETIKVLSELDD